MFAFSTRMYTSWRHFFFHLCSFQRPKHWLIHRICSINNYWMNSFKKTPVIFFKSHFFLLMQKVLRRGRQKHICSSLIRLVWYRWTPLKNSRLELVYLTLIFTGIFGISRPKLSEGIRIYLQGETPTLATSCEELTHWKRPRCWERLRAREGDDRGWDSWKASLTRWAWVWVNSGSLWWTGRPGMLRFMGSQRVGHNWATELNWTEEKQWD